jgi:hypothetical protein
LRLSLVSPSINPVRGSQIGKTKLSVRKAEERHSKEGQEGRKEAPQAPPLRSISAYGGDEVNRNNARSDFLNALKVGWIQADSYKRYNGRNDL